MKLLDVFNRVTNNKPAHSAWIRIRDFVPVILWRSSTLDRIDISFKYIAKLFDNHQQNKQLPQNMDFLLFADDNPPDNISPFMAYSSKKDSDDIFMLPFMMFSTFENKLLSLDEWSYIWIQKYDIPFEERDDTLFWRGGYNQNRQHIIEFCKDVHKTDLQFSPPYIPLENQNNHKYILDMKGIGWSGRLPNFFWMGAVIFIIDRDYHEYWWFKEFIPWVHFVPVNGDGSNLGEVLEQVRNMTDNGKSIADACRLKAKEILTNKYIDEYTCDMLKSFHDKYGFL